MEFVKHIAIDSICVIIAVFCSKGFFLKENTYLAWISLGIKVASVWIMVIGIINYIFYKDKVKNLYKVLKK